MFVHTAKQNNDNNNINILGLFLHFLFDILKF